MKHELIHTITSYGMDAFKTNWLNIVNKPTSRTGTGGNKLRTYRLFKQTFEVEAYCKMILPRSHRSALSKFRSGVAAIRLETGRYERLPCF